MASIDRTLWLYTLEKKECKTFLVKEQCKNLMGHCPGHLHTVHRPGTLACYVCFVSHLMKCCILHPSKKLYHWIKSLECNSDCYGLGFVFHWEELNILLLQIKFRLLTHNDVGNCAAVILSGQRKVNISQDEVFAVILKISFLAVPYKAQVKK